MNIDDVEAPTERPSCLLTSIREHQVNHLAKYLEIEGKSGIGLGLLRPEERAAIAGGATLDLHDRVHQYLIKDYFWRTAEELTEATDAGDHREHYLEELIDGLHFFLEIMQLTGYWPTGKLEDYFEQTASLERPPTPYDIIERIGCAANVCKNKSWKTSAMLTDIPRFYGHLGEAWVAFISLFRHEGLSAEDVYDLYFRKSTVNSFRQRSKY